MFAVAARPIRAPKKRGLASAAWSVYAPKRVDYLSLARSIRIHTLCARRLANGTCFVPLTKIRAMWVFPAAGECLAAT
jgi:hypothetical protein